MTRPPRLPQAILRCVVPAAARDSVDGDLAELYVRQVASRGRARATLWYWRQVLSFAARFALDRVTRGAAILASLREAASSLDVRLGGRLLIKNPGLTLIAGFGIAAAIGISTGFFAFVAATFEPRIPLDEGDRLVALENANLLIGQPDRRSARDFLAWRDELKTVVDVSAFANTVGELETAPATVEDITIAAMTASGFHLARVPALLGRYLVPADERAAAPPVLVIGYDAWRTRFAGDSSIVGRRLRINDALVTVVGVMPKGFGFPVNHQYWVPLKLEPSTIARGEGPTLFVFGRLAPGATMQSAAAELATVGRRAAAVSPRTNGQLRATILPYTYPFIGVQAADGGAQAGFRLRMTLTIALIVIVAALNVAILVYARTAMRRSEIAVRTALGANRRRIVGQLFVEALALSLPPALLGLALAQYGLRLGSRLLGEGSDVLSAGPPFWSDFSIRPATAAYALGLALVVATIVGVLPALQATGRHIESDLRQLGGATGMQLGTMWTGLVVAQVAIAVAVLPPALKNAFQEGKDAFTRATYPANAFTSGLLTTKRTPVPGGSTSTPFGARLGDVVRALRADASVAGVAFSSSAPTGGAWRGRIEVEGLAVPRGKGRRPVPQSVDTSYLDVYGARLLTGRRFAPSDLSDSARTVIVNRSFVHRVLGDRPALGRRLRYASAPQLASDTTASPPWFEIVGVVDDLYRNAFDADVVAPRVYHPLAPERLSAVTLVVRTKGAVPPAFGTTVHRTIAATDPDLRLGTLIGGERIFAVSRSTLQLIGTMMLLVVGAVLLLSAGGVYALMSFTVAQRRREIGIRTALGGSHQQVLIKVFSRAAWQIGAGVVIGAAASASINSATGPEASVPSIILVPIVAVIMIVTGLGAAYLPTRRGLAVEPVEALRSE